MISTPHTKVTLYTCMECKAEFPLDLDPKMLEIVGGSVLCYACSKMHLPLADPKEQLCFPSKENSLHCDICKKSFNSEVDFHLHPITHAVENVQNFNPCFETIPRDADQCAPLRNPIGDNRFFCEICQKTFPCRSKLKEHSCTLTREVSLICETCHKSFSRYFELKEHSCTGGKSHESVFVKHVSFSETCQKMFSTPHIKLKLYTCMECKEEFPLDLDPKILEKVNGSVLCYACSKMHLPLADPKEQLCFPSKENSLHCLTCKKRFNSEVDFHLHPITHAVEKFHNFNPCFESFPGDADQCTPLRNPIGDNRFFCEICQKTFSCQFELKKHSCSVTRKKLFICEICDKTFSWHFELKQHSFTHTSESFSCKTCKKTFPCHSDLKKHSYTHEEEMSFICTTCKRTFSCYSGLEKHSCTHTGGKSYPCKMCDKTFSYSSHLKRHHRFIHTGEKPYICDVCERAFVERAALRLHFIRRHSKEKPHTCCKCKKAFADKGYLKIHQWRCKELHPWDSRNTSKVLPE